MKKMFALVASMSVLGLASTANATVYNFALTISDPAALVTTLAGGIDAFGNVSVNDAGGNLAFDMKLNPAWEMRHASDSNHWSFAFNTSKSFTYSGITLLGGGAATATAFTGVNASPFGAFTNALNCNAGIGKPKPPCLPGWHPLINPTELKFTANGLALSDLFQSSTVYGGKRMWFIADVVNAAGKTGNVGAATCTLATGGGSCFGGSSGGGVPEPASWALMIGGMGLTGAALRRRRTAVAA